MTTYRFSSVLPFVLLLAAAAARGATAPAAEPGAEQYAKVLSAEPDLAAYWPLDGDLKDAKGNLDCRAQGGPPQFGDGPGGGKVLLLEKGRFGTMGNTPQLDLKETTAELWFQPDFKPGVPYNPCIIAKRAHGDPRKTRFSFHVWNDYSCLAVWTGRQVAQYRAGDGPLRRGQWYHLAVTCTADQMQLYLDGVLCRLVNPAGVFDFAQANLPLSVGSSTSKGQELLDGRIAQVAIYGKALSQEDIARHVDAMGWRERRLQLAAAEEQRLKREAELRARREAQRADRLAALTSPEKLFAPGKQKVYRDEYLPAISLTLGGIGTGSIQINGRAERAIWQIFNNHKHAVVPNSFFAVRVKAAAGKPVVRALQTAPVGPFAAINALSFRGEYPFAWYEFEDPALPVKIGMETFNPLVPLDAKNSAIPCAIFNLSVKNTTDKPVEVSFLGAQQNAVGYLGEGPISGRAYGGFGSNKNRVLRGPQATLLHMTAGKPKDARGAGDMALMAMDKDAAATASWEGLEKLAASFAADGTVSGPDEAGPSPAGQTIDGAIVVRFRLAAGEKRTVPFVLAWHFPNGPHGHGGWGGGGAMYAVFWPDALAVVGHLEKNLDELTRKTRLYHDSLYASNLPHWLLDRIGSQLAVLRSQTCFWTKAGYFGGWEGCSRARGCCHGNCNHVWHYAQAHARLFPSIARRMRQQEFRFQAADGAIPHRQPKSHPAFDGQCGAVLNSYREHLMCPRGEWLQKHWPNVKKAMDYLIARWDNDEDGVLAGAQWNTLDGALAGSSSWLGTLYLAALRAAEKMALLRDDPETAKRYARICASGCKKQNETLFNGEYYFQIPQQKPHEDYGTGCHIDQVLGQWWAHQLDLGWLYPPDRVRTALKSLLKYNFQTDFHGIRQSPRKFVGDDDPGMQMITWPKGPRPAKVIRYGDEVMTGFEYSAAAAMVQAGLLREGFAVVSAIATRYDGRLRTGLTGSDYSSWGYSGNPFGDDECGKFYARAMSVWSMLLACQGYVYDGPAGRIGFRPVWKPEDHKSFFTAAEGWGLFTQTRKGNVQTERIEVRCGKLPVSSLVFELPEKSKAAKVAVRLGQREVAARFITSGSEVRVTLEKPLTAQTDDVLEVTITAQQT